MKWKSRKDIAIKKKSTWHKWFAWHPVYLMSEGEVRTRVWLEVVERIGYYHRDPIWGSHWWTYEYKEKGKL